LIARLSGREAGSRANAAQQLARLGEEARPAAVPLVRCCGDDDEPVREWSTAALEELGPPSPTDAEALAELLDHASADVGFWAATLLGRLGDKGAPAAAQLIQVLESSPHAAVRQRAAWALGQIGPAAAASLSALQHAASSEDSRLARLAQRAMEQIQR
jgi:HEAT repeat protein